MKTKILISLAAILIVLGIGFFGYMAYLDIHQTPQQVSQTPPPSQDPTASWNTLKNDELGFSLKYPSGFFDVGHEPKIITGNCSYAVLPAQCPSLDAVVPTTPAGNPGNLPAHTIAVNNHKYCAYALSDAAMGHQYYYDYYLTTKAPKCLVVQLDSATTTCENYLPIEAGNTQQQQNYDACVAQRTSRPNILQQIVGTFQLAN